MALKPARPDGTEGTATADLTYKDGKKKITLTFFGCIVENDANLQSFIRNDINQSADRKKFETTKYFFYTCDPDLKVGRIIKTVVTYHRFSKPSKPKSCNVSSSPDNFVRVQEHLFLLCDSQDKCDLNGCSFLKEYSKKIRVAQKLNTKEKIYGLSCEEEKDCLRFIPLNFKLNHKSSNVYGIDAENYEKLEEAGPVLQDGKTVVGSFEKLKGNNEISISIFGNNQDNEREDYSSGSGTSGQVESAEARSHPGELVPAVKKSEAKLEEKKNTPQFSSPPEGVVKLDEESEEKTMEELNKNTPQSSSHEVMAGNLKNGPKLDKEPTEDTTREEDQNTPQLPLEKKGSQPEEGNDKQEMLKHGQDHEYEFPENKNTPQSSSHEVMTGNPKIEPKLVKQSEDTTMEEDKNTRHIQLPLEKKGSHQPEEGNDEQEMSKQGQEHEYQFPGSPSSLEDQTDSKNEKFDKQEINGASSSCWHPTDSYIYEGCVQQQPTAKIDILASQDEQKTINEKKELLTITLKPEQDSNNDEKLASPIQVSCSDSDDCYNPLEEIKKTLKDGSNQLKDDLSQKQNIKKYRRFLLHVAQNATGKCKEIGESLDITNNKLQSLKVDYKSEGNAEQTYQMLVHWKQSNPNPTLEKLLVALIGTELVNVANEVSDMLTDSRSIDGTTVTEKLLNKITNDVKDVWKFLGRYLGIDESAIHSIKMDNCDDTREQARQMFVKWKQSNGSRAKTGILINALHDVGKSNVAKIVEVWERQTQLF